MPDGGLEGSQEWHARRSREAHGWGSTLSGPQLSRPSWTGTTAPANKPSGPYTATPPGHIYSNKISLVKIQSLLKLTDNGVFRYIRRSMAARAGMLTLRCIVKRRARLQVTDRGSKRIGSGRGVSGIMSWVCAFWWGARDWCCVVRDGKVYLFSFIWSNNRELRSLILDVGFHRRKSFIRLGRHQAQILSAFNVKEEYPRHTSTLNDK